MTEGLGYVIELGGAAAGLVVKEGNRFRFYAAEKSFAGLERNLYQSPGEAEDACRRVAPGRATRPQAAQRGSYLSDVTRTFGRRVSA